MENVETAQNLKQQRSKSCPEQSEFLFKAGLNENQSLKKLKVLFFNDLIQKNLKSLNTIRLSLKLLTEFKVSI